MPNPPGFDRDSPPSLSSTRLYRAAAVLFAVSAASVAFAAIGMHRAPALAGLATLVLGLAAYAQVTSPIRRYQDLAAHRQIVAALLESGNGAYDMAPMPVN